MNDQLDPNHPYQILISQAKKVRKILSKGGRQVYTRKTIGEVVKLINLALIGED